MDAIPQFKIIDREAAALAAWQERRYVLLLSPDQLRHSDQMNHFEWASDENMKEVVNITDPVLFDDFYDFYGITTQWGTMLPGRVSSVLSDYPYADHASSNRSPSDMVSSTPKVRSALLLIRPSSWPTTAPELCLLHLGPRKPDLRDCSVRSLQKLLKGKELDHAFIPTDVEKKERDRYRKVCHDWLYALKQEEIIWPTGEEIIHSCVPEKLLDQ